MHAWAGEERADEASRRGALHQWRILGAETCRPAGGGLTWPGRKGAAEGSCALTGHVRGPAERASHERRLLRCRRSVWVLHERRHYEVQKSGPAGRGLTRVGRQGAVAGVLLSGTSAPAGAGLTSVRW